MRAGGTGLKSWFVMVVVRRARGTRRSVSTRTRRAVSARSCEGWVSVSPRSVGTVYPAGWGRARWRGAGVVSVVVMVVAVMMVRLRRSMRTGTVVSWWSAWPWWWWWSTWRWSRGMLVVVMVVRE
ncbi:hypothetical protein BDW68DRAFT_170401 [Aspergillus falconensis]